MNKIYHLVWNYLTQSWSVTSELVRKSKKASAGETSSIDRFAQKDVLKETQLPHWSFRKLVQSVLMATTLLYGASGYALTSTECSALGSSCTVVRTAAELATALGSTGTATTIVLANDITLAGNITAQMLNSNRQNITIDGGGFKLDTGVYEFNVLGDSTAKWGNTVGSLNFQNFNALNSTTATGYTVVRVEPNMAINVGFDNIQKMTDSMYTVMGNMGAGGTPNLKGEVVFGNVAPINLTYGINHQFSQLAKVRFTGNFSLTAPGDAGAYNTVFWSNAATIENQMTFDSTAHVDIRATYLTLVNGGLNNNAFQYKMADGAYFKLRTPQNIFGSNNAGLVLGSYNTATGFGGGVVLDVAGYNGEAVVGHGVSNLGGDVGALVNGRTKNGDVVFNLANGSILNFTGANNAGMYVAKNAGVGGNLFLRSDAVMNANSANGIQIEHQGTGKVVALNDTNGVINAQKGIALTATANADSVLIQNKGRINSSLAGIELNMNAANKIVELDMQGGTIYASAGNGIDVKAQSVLNLRGGDIYAANAANGLQIGNQLQHQIQGLNIAVQGTGAGLSVLSGTDLSAIAANIKVEAGANGTGLLIKDGSSAINSIRSGLNIDAAGQNAIRVTGTQAKTVDLGGSINGNVVFENTANNTLILNNTLNGNAQLGAGSDTVQLKSNTALNGNLDLGAGNNQLAIEQGAVFNGQLVAGAGNDSVTVKNNGTVGAAMNLGAGDDQLLLESGASLLGNVLLGDGNDQLVLNQADVTRTRIGVIDGGAGNNLLVMNASQWVMDADTRLLNFNQFDLTGSTLEVASADSAQISTVNLDAGSRLTFGAAYQANFAGVLNGTGAVAVKGDVSLTSNSNFSGTWDIQSGGHLQLTDEMQLGTASVQNQGHLSISGLNTFNRAISGNGVLSVNNSPSNFTFGSSFGNAFTGVVEMNNSQITLDTAQSTVLRNATLALANNSRAELSSTQTIGNIKFAGGTLDVDLTSPITSNVLNVTDIQFEDASGLGHFGTINLRGALALGTVTEGNFLDEDDIKLQGGGMLIINASRISSEGRILDVTIDGVTPTDTHTYTRLDTAGNTIEATYSYVGVASNRSDLSSGSGIYVSYLLKQLKTTGDLELTTAGATSRETIAQITGAGKVTINAEGNRFTLQNEANDYTGATVVESGTLVLGNSGVLGTTSLLSVASNTGVDWNGAIQKVGGLDLAQNSALDLNNGHITVTGDGVSSAALSGAGIMEFTGGTTTINGANTQLSADVLVGSAGALELHHVNALGSGDVLADGRLAFAQASGDFTNSIAGTGVVAVSDAQVNLTASNTDFTGSFDIAADGQLRAQSVAALGGAQVQNDGQLQVNTDAGTAQTLTAQVQGSGDFVKQGAGILRVENQLQHTGKTVVQQGALALNSTTATLAGTEVHIESTGVLAGYGTIQTDVLNEGRLAVADALGAVDAGTGTLTITGNLQNHAAVDLVGQQPGNHLLVKGNYSAHSDLHVSAALAGDDTVIDTVTVEGSTSGHTTLFVTNRGGKGAQTTNGIEVVEVLGDSVGTFGLASRVVAGAYDYQLVQQGKNWFLQSAQMGVRPEVGGYLANQEIAQTMFQQSYAERLQGRTPENGAWGYIRAERVESLAANEIDQTIYQQTMRIGADVWQSEASDNGQWTVGVMAGAGKARSRNANARMEARADTNVDGYSVGGYASWNQTDATTGSSTYVDSWLQYGWFDNTLKGTELGSEGYNSRVASASVEVGHQMVLSKDEGSAIFLTPSVQMIAYDRSSDNLVESSATRVGNHNQQGFYSKAGAKVSGEFAGSDATIYSPYLGAYWNHQSTQAKVSMDDESFTSNKPKNVLEAQIGLDIQNGKNWDVSLHLGGQVGKDNYSQLEGRVGVRYQW